ncbi:hypothetical protein A2U01_0041819, partial [Trifolium medium]|nr:hypothetical protein [Trifolium medium]
GERQFERGREEWIYVVEGDSGGMGVEATVWQPDPEKGFSVRAAYHLLTSQDSIALDACDDLIWHKQALSHMMITCALLNVEALNRLKTYSSHAVPLVHYGLGSTFRQWILKIWLTTLSSSLMQQVAFERVGPFYNSFG